MLLEHFAIATSKEVPSDAEATSHKLLARGGFITKHGAGLYTFTPLGYRVLNNIQSLVNGQLEQFGALQIQAPIMQPASLWQQSGRWDVYQHSSSMFTVEDRKGAQFGLAPTAEEVVTDVAKSLIRSAKQLPVTFFQTQAKFRDEMRVRFGLIRTKEFVMMDAYSFDIDQQGMERSYNNVARAYQKIFSAMDLNYKTVAADMGDMGGTKSEEYMALCDIGEDTLLYNQNYAANIETAIGKPSVLPAEPLQPIENVTESESVSINDFASGLGLDTAKAVVGHLYKANYSGRSEYGVVFTRGDDSPNKVKVANIMGALSVEEIPEEAQAKILGPDVILSPLAQNVGMRHFFDHELANVSNAVCHGPKSGEFSLNFNLSRDCPNAAVTDLRLAKAGDVGPGGQKLEVCKGIEIGHIFQLGTKYSKALNAGVVDPTGQFKPFVMGCYGVGISRLVAAVVEQHHDERGIIWPEAIAPYQVHVVPLKYTDDNVRRRSHEVYEGLKGRGLSVLMDNRDATPGTKFSDADLLGIPYQVILGKSLERGAAEIKHRASGEREEVPLDQLADRLTKVIGARSKKFPETRVQDTYQMQPNG